MENGNMENESMDVQQNVNLEMCGLEMVRVGSSDVLTCVDDNGLSLGMEICTYDNTGMGMEGDEEILTASSLEHIHNSEGNQEEEMKTNMETMQTEEDITSFTSFNNQLLPRHDTHDQNDQLTLSLPGHRPRLFNDDNFSADDSSAIDTVSQSSQSDLTYCMSLGSTSQGDSTFDPLTSDVATATASDDEDNGGSKSVTEDGVMGGKVGVSKEVHSAEEGGKRKRRGKARSFGRRRRTQTKDTSKSVGPNSQRAPHQLERLREVGFVGESSDSSDTYTTEDDRTTTAPGSSCRRQSNKSLHGTILASILTDIPEVDIRPLSECPQHSKTSDPARRLSGCKVEDKDELERKKEEESSNNKDKKKRKKPTRRWARDRWGRKGRGSRQERPEGSPSNHYRILMSWERDYPLGLDATRAPVLYALDTIPEKVRAVKGGWFERAKLIWTTWRRAHVDKRDEYCERAKFNRLKVKETDSLINNETKSDKTRPTRTRLVPNPPPLPTKNNQQIKPEPDNTKVTKLVPSPRRPSSSVKPTSVKLEKKRESEVGSENGSRANKKKQDTTCLISGQTSLKQVITTDESTSNTCITTKQLTPGERVNYSSIESEQHTDTCTSTLTLTSPSLSSPSQNLGMCLYGSPDKHIIASSVTSLPFRLSSSPLSPPFIPLLHPDHPSIPSSSATTSHTSSTVSFNSLPSNFSAHGVALTATMKKNASRKMQRRASISVIPFSGKTPPTLQQTTPTLHQSHSQSHVTTTPTPPETTPTLATSHTHPKYHNAPTKTCSTSKQSMDSVSMETHRKTTESRQRNLSNGLEKSSDQFVKSTKRHLSDSCIPTSSHGPTSTPLPPPPPSLPSSQSQAIRIKNRRLSSELLSYLMPSSSLDTPALSTYPSPLTLISTTRTPTSTSISFSNGHITASKSSTQFIPSVHTSSSLHLPPHPAANSSRSVYNNNGTVTMTTDTSDSHHTAAEPTTLSKLPADSVFSIYRQRNVGHSPHLASTHAVKTGENQKRQSVSRERPRKRQTSRSSSNSTSTIINGVSYGKKNMLKLEACETVSKSGSHLSNVSSSSRYKLSVSEGSSNTANSGLSSANSSIPRCSNSASVAGSKFVSPISQLAGTSTNVGNSVGTLRSNISPPGPPMFTQVPSVTTAPQAKKNRRQNTKSTERRSNISSSVRNSNQRPSQINRHSNPNPPKTLPMTPTSSLCLSLPVEENKTLGPGSVIPLGLDALIPQLPTDLQLTNQLKGFMKQPKDTNRLNTISQIRTCTTVTTTHCTCISTPSTSAISQIYTPSTSAISQIYTPSTSAISQIYTPSTSAIPQIYTPSTSAISQIYTPSTSAISQIYTPSTSAISQIYTPSTSAIPQIYTPSTSAISQIYTPSTSAISQIYTPSTSAIPQIYTPSTSAISQIYTPSTSAISQIFNNTSTMLHNGTTQSSSITSNAIEPAANRANRVKTQSDKATVKKRFNNKRKRSFSSEVRGKSRKKSLQDISKPNESGDGGQAAASVSHTGSLPSALSILPATPTTPHTPIPQTSIPHTIKLESVNSTPTPPTPFGTLIPGQPVFNGMIPGQPNLLGQPGILLGQSVGNLSGQLTPPYLGNQGSTNSYNRNLVYWELERLYYHNLALLEQQRQYTKYLETQLHQMEQICRQAEPGNHLATKQLQNYQQFLSYIVEPDFETSIPEFLSESVTKSYHGNKTTRENENGKPVFRETTNGLELLPELDFYDKFLNQHKNKLHDTT